MISKATLLRALMAGALCAGTAIGGAAPASALTINLLGINNISSKGARDGFQIAAGYWESVLTNDATMNIQVGFQPLGPDILGSTGSNLFTYVPISDYKSLLASNTIKSTIDNKALANFPAQNAAGSVKVIVPDYLDPASATGVTDNYDTRIAPRNGEAISSTMALSTANAKALINDPSFGANIVDANITFSSQFSFDFRPENGIRTNAYDFIGVAIHEIGHALGFLSAADDFDYSAGTGGYPTDDFWWGYALDMFRYSAPTKLDWSYGTASYFSLNGGVSPYLDGYFSTGSNFGNGYQASHWAPPGPLPCVGFRGVMNPYLCNGTNAAVTALDLSLFDAIGWNVDFDVNANRGYRADTGSIFRATGLVPEPAMWAMMIGGMGAVGGALRSRRRKTVSVSFG